MITVCRCECQRDHSRESVTVDGFSLDKCLRCVSDSATPVSLVNFDDTYRFCGLQVAMIGIASMNEQILINRVNLLGAKACEMLFTYICM